MRKANKILMATVAILLCLVLITTSVASGIFAKFVINGKGTSTISFEKFGVTVTMSIPDASLTALQNAGAQIDIDSNNNKPIETFTSEGHTITISNLKMRPGVVVPKAVKFAFTGEPTVPVQIKITPTVIYDSKVHTDTQNADETITYHNYYVPADTIIQSIAANGTITYMPATYYMPLGFNFSYNSDGLTANTTIAVNPWSSSTTKSDVTASKISNEIAKGIFENRLGANTKAIASLSSGSNIITIGTFPAATDATKDESIKLHINTKENCDFFHMGFYYPLDWPTDTSADKEKYDKISTYIAEHTDPDCTITVSYTVELVQT